MKKKQTLQLSRKQLDELVEEATIDCYNESEQVTGLYTMIEDNVSFPFQAEILGAAVSLEGIDLTDRDEIVAICTRGKHRQRIRLDDLPLPSPPPPGAEWIAAYSHWARFAAPPDSDEEDS